MKSALLAAALGLSAATAALAYDAPNATNNSTVPMAKALDLATEAAGSLHVTPRTPQTTVNPQDPNGTEQVWIVPFKR